MKLLSKIPWCQICGRTLWIRGLYWKIFNIRAIGKDYCYRHGKRWGPQKCPKCGGTGTIYN